MKIIHLAVILLLLLNVTAFGQEIPKGADAITLTTNLSDSALVAKAVSILDDQGFVAVTADTRLGRIVTEEKATVGQFTLRILATAKQGVLLLRGQYSLHSMNIINQPAEQKGMGGSIPKKMYAKLVEIAELIKTDTGATSLEYVIQAKK